MVHSGRFWTVKIPFGLNQPLSTCCQPLLGLILSLSDSWVGLSSVYFGLFCLFLVSVGLFRPILASFTAFSRHPLIFSRALSDSLESLHGKFRHVWARVSSRALSRFFGLFGFFRFLWDFLFGPFWTLLWPLQDSLIGPFWTLFAYFGILYSVRAAFFDPFLDAFEPFRGLFLLVLFWTRFWHISASLHIVAVLDRFRAH